MRDFEFDRTFMTSDYFMFCSLSPLNLSSIFYYVQGSISESQSETHNSSTLEAGPSEWQAKKLKLNF